MKWTVKRCLILSIAYLLTSACTGNKRTIIDLSPKYKPKTLIVPENWRGKSPFKTAKPADEMPKGAWWKVYHDSVLNRLEAQFLKTNPTLQMAAERFIQSRYEMMKAQSEYMPHIGTEGNYYKNQRSVDDLLNGQVPEFAPPNTSSFAGLVSWEPDIFSRFRNAANIRIFQAQASAAEYGALRLMLQAELAADYFTLRGLDAKIHVYTQSIAYYKKCLNLVNDLFVGNLASRLDVARAKFLLSETQAKRLSVQAKRQVVEHAIAALVNTSASTFSIEPVQRFTIPNLMIPRVLPAQLVERRPDIAALERKMAQANKAIGISRAAFFPKIDLSSRDTIFLMSQVSNVVWAVGSIFHFNLFEAGYRRAQLKKSWSVYRETLNHYRQGVLDAFREVENGLSKTNLYKKELAKQDKAVEAAFEAQELTMDLFTGRLGSSLEVLYAQINTLEARIKAVEIKINLMVSSVYLIKALGGSWSEKLLPKDADIQPFRLFEYSGLNKIKPAGHIGKTNPAKHANLASSSTVRTYKKKKKAQG